MSGRREAPPLERALESARGSAPSIESFGDAFPAGVFVTDAAGRCVYANPRVQELLGLTAAELTRDGFVAAVDPAERPTIEEEFAAAVAGAAEWQAEFRCRRGDGSASTLGLHSVPLRSPDGAVTGHIAAVEDVSLRNRLYAKLTALIETSRILLDTPRLGAVLPAAVQVAKSLIAADGYALWRLQDGADWRVVESNGVSPAFAAAVVPLSGAAIARFDTPLAVNDVTAATALANRHEAYAAEGVRALLAVPLHIRGSWSGSLVFYYQTVQHFDHIRMETAAALGNLCAVAIATAELYEEQLAQRERLERAHRQSTFLARAGVILGSSLDYEATLEAVAQLAVPDIADWCVVDIAADDGRLKRLGTAHIDPAKIEFARTLRERFPEDPGSPGTPTHVLRTRQPAMISGITDEMLQQGARSPAHLEALRTLQLHSYISVPLVANGRALGVMTFVTAESQRAYDNEDLLVAQSVAERAALAVDNARAYSEARAANRAKDEFLATLSHELRTPINAIMGWGQILQTGIVDPSRTAHAIDAIVRNAAAQARLIEDLLDLSRIISGKLRLDVELVDLGGVVSAAVLTIEPASQVKGLRIQTVVEDGPARVYGDRQRLQQAVWNLLSNAVKFTPRGGSVQIHVRRVGSQVEIMVSDTGEGISPDVLPFVFDRFRQADSSSTRSHTGLGLGLAIARHIVELHGGTVHAASEGLGKGTTFRLRLPISVAAAEPADAGKVHPAVPAITTGSLAIDALPDLAGTSILIVEDDADAREMVAYLMRQRNADVVACASVDEALREFDRRPPDVLLSDIEMPLRDGFALIAAVRARSAADGGDVPAAALTAYSRAEDRAASMMAGYDAHLSKPVDLHELIATVVRLRARRR
jgi:PAS domain S-box-containing protein